MPVLLFPVSYSHPGNAHRHVFRTVLLSSHVYRGFFSSLVQPIFTCL